MHSAPDLYKNVFLSLCVNVLVSVAKHVLNTFTLPSKVTIVCWYLI